MRKNIFLFFFLFVVFFANAQKVYRTSPLTTDIKTLQIYPSGQALALPIIELGTPTNLFIQFDQMSHSPRSYSYRVFLCNQDWTENTEMISNEYIKGFPKSAISDYTLSTNTTHLYTNYSFSLPNDDTKFIKSGNYVVQIYEDGKVEEPVAQACFSVVEQLVEIQAQLRGNTDLEINRRFQQLDFDVKLKGHPLRNPQEELKVLVRQNNRNDNEVVLSEPTFYQADVLNYVNNKDLIFEGGNEYYRFDIGSVYSGSNRVERIEFRRPYYHVFLYKDFIDKTKTYVFEPDANGRYIINLQESHFNLNTEADYINVYFSIPKEEPFFDGHIYIGGEWNNNALDENSYMQYDFETACYVKELLLKQGGYNYQYWFLRKGETVARTEPISGSFWQTQNEYAIYVYQREWGSRYDRLIGVKILE